MSRRLDVRRWLTATVLSLGLAASTLGAQPASADAATDAPVTAPDKVTVWSGDMRGVNVLANDSDPDGDPLVVSEVGAASHGTVVLNADQSITYTPAADYNGPDSFTYTITDGIDVSTGVVLLTVTDSTVEDAPAASSPSRSACAHAGWWRALRATAAPKSIKNVRIFIEGT